MQNNTFNFENYPRTKHFLEITGMTLDEALSYTKIQLEKLENGQGSGEGEERNYN